MADRENERNPSVETAVRPCVKTFGSESRVVESYISDISMVMAPQLAAREW